MAEEKKTDCAQGEDLEPAMLEDVTGGSVPYTFEEGMKCYHCGYIFPPGTEKCSLCGRALVN